MSLEGGPQKPDPLYNQEGQVNDPEIARKMAEHEEELRQDPEKLKFAKKVFETEDDREAIEASADDEGDVEHGHKRHEYQKEMIQHIADKIKGVLTEEELAILQSLPGKITDKIFS